MNKWELEELFTEEFKQEIYRLWCLVTPVFKNHNKRSDYFNEILGNSYVDMFKEIIAMVSK